MVQSPARQRQIIRRKETLSLSGEEESPEILNSASSFELSVGIPEFSTGAVRCRNGLCQDTRPILTVPVNGLERFTKKKGAVSWQNVAHGHLATCGGNKKQSHKGWIDFAMDGNRYRLFASTYRTQTGLNITMAKMEKK